jgi:hypothetical protein
LLEACCDETDGDNQHKGQAYSTVAKSGWNSHKAHLAILTLPGDGKSVSDEKV